MSLSCNVCSRSFSTSQALQQHERDSPRHLGSSGEHVSQVQTKQNKASSRPPPQHQFRCLTCQRSFNSNQALEQHKRDSPRHAGGAHQQQNIQPSASNIPTSTQQQQSPPNRSEATYVCGPCNRSFASEEALQQHRRDSAAHQMSPTPLDIFFRSFPGFPYESVLPPATSYAQLEQHQGWAPHSAASRDAWRQYQEALRDELQMWYGDEDNLTAWHALCRAIGVNPLPGTCEQCVVVRISRSPKEALARAPTLTRIKGCAEHAREHHRPHRMGPERPTTCREARADLSNCGQVTRVQQEFE